MQKFITKMSKSPKIYSLKDNPNFKGILTPQLRKLVGMLRDEGHEVRVAGGAVRDLLLGLAPDDVDLATTATPDQITQIFEKNRVRTFNALGLKHGTVTARIDDTQNFEVTTLRIDTKTDGRRCEVEFTKDWFLDANRRDLTINSMFLDVEGTVYDFFDGKTDLEKRRIAFVGDAEQRIREDYLRILRYFRFYGRIATDPDSGHENKTLDAIRENVAGLAQISGERIWSEWKKILSGNFAGPLTLRMIDCGLHPYIGLPDKPNVDRFAETWESTKEADQTRLHPVTFLTSLLNDEKEMMELHARLKLSGFERDLGLFVIAHRDSDFSNFRNPIRPYQYLIIDTLSGTKLANCRQWVIETMMIKGRSDLITKIQEWEVPRLPVTGSDLLEAGCPKGKLMSQVLFKLKDIWKLSDFESSQEELVEVLPKVLDEIRDNPPEIPHGKRRKLKFNKKD